MSSNQDQSQKPKSPSSNVVQLFKESKPNPNLNGNSTSTFKPHQPGLNLDPGASTKVRTAVIKAADLKKEISNFKKVQDYSPVEMIGNKTISRPDSLPALSVPQLAVESLKQNLKNLKDLQSRLRFLLKEIEEFTHE